MLLLFSQSCLLTLPTFVSDLVCWFFSSLVSEMSYLNSRSISEYFMSRVLLSLAFEVFWALSSVI